MKISFLYVRWRNFLSTGLQWSKIDFTQAKTTLIMGENGAGKSTMLDALAFALFNKPFRKILKNQMINTINGKECEVEVAFVIKGKTYRVVRGIKPNVFDIFEDDVLLNKDAAAKDYQAVLESQILHMDYKTFCQVVLVGNAGFVPFMQLAAAQRRELIETLLDLGVFTDMNAILKERISENKKEVQFTGYKLDSFEDKLRLQRGIIAALKKSSDDQIAYLDGELARLQDSIDNEPMYEKELAAARAIKADLEARIDKIRMLHAKLTGQRREAHQEVKYLQDNDVCRQCGQTIDAAFKDEHLKEAHGQIEKLDPAIAELMSKLDDAQARLDNTEAEIDGYLAIEGRILDAQRQMRRIDQRKEELQNAKEAEELVGAQATLNTMLDEEKIAREKYGSLTSTGELYQMAATMLKDTGIKAKVITNYIGVINAKINEYLEKLDLFVQYELDENFEETIKSRHRDEFSYASFSEGEKARIDFAILMTWRDIAKMRNSISCNLLVLDEVFDSSLNHQGEYLAMQVLRNLEDTNLVVISHKRDKVDWFDRVLTVEKVNNFSKIGD